MPSTARTWPTVRLNSPFVIGKCFSSPDTSSRFSLIVHQLRSEVRKHFLLEDLGAILRRKVTGDQGAGPGAGARGTQDRHLGEGPVAVAPRVRAARVEGAAVGQVDQAGRRALDRGE